MKAKRSKKRRDIPALEWINDVSGAPRATLIGSSRVLVENHTGLVEFCPEKVRLATKRGEIIVDGTGLSIRDARFASVVVMGRISSVIMPPDPEAGQ